MEQYFKEAIDLQHAILRDKVLLDALKESVALIEGCLKRGHKLLIAGNGGSAADAQHFAAELVGRFKKERKAYPALALTVDTSIITAWSNDYSFESVFARQIEAYGNAGDIFIGISTSGNSSNLLAAVKEAKEKGIFSLCLLGRGGGALKDICDKALIVPSDNIPRIQEVHEMLLHIICEEVERGLVGAEAAHENTLHHVLS
ncbi:MAG: D-sedoheptulose 7-phosphate isomerase [Patescibacteria group bacterium]|jgi:D-sedoheptulose 7-phosphate isomerase